MDMSTRDAETAIDLAIPAGADNGTLTIMVGDNIQKCEKIRSILEVLGEEIFT